VDLSKIYNSPDVLGLILSFYVSFAISARKTALILNMVFQLKLSYQTVLNYAEAAAFYCHNFNLTYKGNVDDTQAGDEAYIKVSGEQHYTFFFISSKNRKITAYHLDTTRDTLPATIAMQEAIRTAHPHQHSILVTDGNPAYPAGIHFINSQSINKPDIHHRKVIGLQNLDEESAEFRPFKQLIERLMRTYKHHVRPSHGFNSINGAVALTTLFVTHYNFLRPHSSLKYKTPVLLSELDPISTIQGRWAKILSLAV
jgi:putative transposase